MPTEQQFHAAADRYAQAVRQHSRYSPLAVAAHRDWHILAFGPLPALLSIQPSIPPRLKESQS